MENKRNVLTNSLLIVLGMVFVFAFPGAVYGYESVLKFELKPGPYAVGFKVVDNYDYTRTYFGKFDQYGEKVKQKARPIQTCVWYPADAKKAGQKERMRFRDYAYLVATELGARELTPAVKDEAVNGFFLFFSTPGYRKPELDVLTEAVQDAEPAPGNFPLVVYGASINCPAFENSVLFEYLAGYGYIVVSSPCVGVASRFVETGATGAEAQARDILFLLGFMHDFPGVDHTKTALMGFSWGGMSAVLAAMRDTRIDAVVCIDGSIAYNKYMDDFITKSPYYNIDKMTMPLLFLRSKQIPPEISKRYGGQPQEKDNFFEDLKNSDAYHIRFNHLMHGNFCSAFIKFMDMKGPDKLESSPEEVNRSYNLACHYVHRFLDATIKGDTGALTYMSNSPQENNIPDGIIVKRFKKGSAPEPSFGEFIYRVKQEGFDKISAVYGEIKKEFPGFSLAEERLTDLAFLMSVQGKIEDVLLLLTFTLEVFPESSDAYYGLGEIYALKGDREAAIKALEKALELNPRSFMAEKKLKELKK